jgi:hypothetical protein
VERLDKTKYLAEKISWKLGAVTVIGIAWQPSWTEAGNQMSRITEYTIKTSLQKQK